MQLIAAEEDVSPAEVHLLSHETVAGETYALSHIGGPPPSADPAAGFHL